MNPILPPRELADRLLSGSAALFPTDTLPALAAAPEAADLLWRLKGRPLSKPLILMAADTDQLLERLGVPWQQAWLEQARRCWPGAVTLVLPIRGALTEALHPGGASLGLRVPASAAARELLRLSGPLATTSANVSGGAPALSGEQAALAFPQLPLLAPLPWPQGSGQASEVLAWTAQADGHGRQGTWQTLRAGAAGAPSEPTDAGGLR